MFKALTNAPVDIRGPRPLPILAVPAAVLRFFADPVGRMRALYGEYGPIAALVDRSPALILACGAEYNRELLTRPDLFEHNSEIPVRTPPGSALARFNQVLPFLNGELHRRRRRLMQPALQRSATLAHAPEIVAVTEATLRTWPTGVQVDLAALIRALTAAVVIRCLFGLDPGGRGDELARSEAGLLQALSSPLTLALPLPLPGTPYRRALTLSAALERQLQALLAAKRAQSPGTDVLANLLAARDEQGAALGDEELIGECNGLFVAGHDTTAQTLVWTIFLLTQHPEHQAELLAEFTTVLAGAPPRPDELPRLQHLDRALRESMRLLPATPMLFIRVCAGEATLGPHTLPRGARVVLSPFITHRDPALFPEPDRFEPARWQRITPSPWQYLPFGAGPRMCLGAAFAEQALRIMLPMILQRFRITIPAGATISRTVHGIALAPKYGLPAVLAPQDGRPVAPATIRGDIHQLVHLHGRAAPV
ncbi:MAG: cytochrome P450 [Nannocystis sp.]|uniref:cytochrome P450 n=1 Tax=Nannocystis sp. TaxID=1962667 RepID=UPI0024207ECB|nr:cytochrome P450 [Nannocystis sp.]MBK9753515.1 cytochrome P450 [Nannocystis sp.]